MKQQLFIKRFPITYVVAALVISFGVYSFIVPLYGALSIIFGSIYLTLIGIIFYIPIKPLLTDILIQEKCGHSCNRYSKNIIFLLVVAGLIGSSYVCMPWFFGSQEFWKIEYIDGENAFVFMLLVFIYLFTALAEEIIFRGVVFTCSYVSYLNNKSTQPLLVASITSSILFALFHFQIDFQSNSFYLIIYLLGVFTSTAGFGYLMCCELIRKCSLKNAVIIHFIFDCLYLMPAGLYYHGIVSGYININVPHIALVWVLVFCIVLIIVRTRSIMIDNK